MSPPDIKEALEKMSPRNNPKINEPKRIHSGDYRLAGLNLDIHKTGITGLNVENIEPYNVYDYLVPELEKMDFSSYIPEYYDCEDRAFWGMAHLRHKFPGCSVGVASGIAKYLPEKFPDKNHAVIVLWDADLNPILWDPLGQQFEEIENPVTDVFTEIYSVISFPPGRTGVVDTVGPLTGLARLPKNSAIIFDAWRIIYDKQDVLNYLKTIPYDDCTEDHSIGSPEFFNDKFRNYDWALWCFVHARRSYVGIPLGISRGKKSEEGSSSTVVIFWSWEEGGLKASYFDPIEKHEVQFSPSWVFV